MCVGVFRILFFGVFTFSTGRAKSAILAIVIHHLKVGAQKCMVKGPAGLSTREASFGFDFTRGEDITKERIWGTTEGSILRGEREGRGENDAKRY